MSIVILQEKNMIFSLTYNLESLHVQIFATQSRKTGLFGWNEAQKLIIGTMLFSLSYSYDDGLLHIYAGILT